MIKVMVTTTSRRLKVRTVIALSVLAWALVGALVIPFHVALSAGLASLSLVVYGPLAVLLLIGAVVTSGMVRVAASVSVSIALFAAFIPLAALLHTARSHNLPLTFQPLEYITFDGDTTIGPSQTETYKTTTRHELKLALYRSQRDDTAPQPVVALLHGGGWRYGNYLETGSWPERLTDAGFTVVSIEYRLSSDSYHTWQDAPEDVRDAVSYLKTHANRLQINDQAIHLMGQSAGGHLALLEAFRSNSVESVIALYPPADLALDYRTSRDKSAELDFIGGPPGQYPDRYKHVSPISYVSSASPRTLLIQGTRDDLVAVDNTRELSARLTEAGVAVETLYLPLTGHSFENQRGGFAAQLAQEKAIRFLKR